jgi:hypothetical protein
MKRRWQKREKTSHRKKTKGRGSTRREEESQVGR